MAAATQRNATPSTRMTFMFVDDEVCVLHALERTLGFLADDHWDLVFESSGAAAVRRMETDRFDGIVTDMVMPGVDGGSVLQRASELSPHAVRIVLSAEMRDTHAQHAFTHAHQILSKPCKVEDIVQVLRASTGARAWLEDDGLRRAVIALDRLPRLPETYRRIQAELARATASAQSLAAIIAADPGLVARMVQVANSPYFGGGRRLDDLRQAIARLGIQLISALAMASVFDEVESDSTTLDMGVLAQRARSTAAIAGRLAGAEAGNAYLAGMLTEVGELVLACTRTQEFDRAAEEAEAGAEPHATQRRVCGVGHASVGAYLLALWGLPSPVADAVLHHHDDLEQLATRNPGPVVMATAVAAAIVGGLSPDSEVLARLGYSPAAVERALAAA